MKVLPTDAPLSAYYDADRTATGLGAPGGRGTPCSPSSLECAPGDWSLAGARAPSPHAAARCVTTLQASESASEKQQELVPTKNDHAEVAGDDGQKKRSGDGVFHGSVRKEKSHDGARSHGLTLSAQYDGCNTSRRKARPQNVGIDAAQRSERYAPLDASNYNLALDGGGTGLATWESCVLYGSQ